MSDSLRNIHESLNIEASKMYGEESTRTHDRYQKEGDYDCYSCTFGNALRELGVSNLTQLFEQRKSLGKGNNVLDLMGSGIFSEATASLDNIVGVRLKNIDNLLKAKALDEYPGMKADIHTVFDNKSRTVLEGNVYERETLNSIKSHMDLRGIEGFDVITCRPFGPFSEDIVEEAIGQVDPNKLKEYFYIQLTRYLSLLNKGGVMITQIPNTRGSNITEEEINTIEKNTGVHCQIFDSEFPEGKVLLLKK